MERAAKVSSAYAMLVAKVESRVQSAAEKESAASHMTVAEIAEEIIAEIVFRLTT